MKTMRVHISTIKTRFDWALTVWLFIARAVSAGSTVQVKPTESLSMLREKLANDANITEVISTQVAFPRLSSHTVFLVVRAVPAAGAEDSQRFN